MTTWPKNDREWARENLPLAVRLRDEAGPPLPQMIAQRRESIQIEARRARQAEANRG